MVDRQPPGQIKIMAVPVEENQFSVNMSDTAFETMGSDVGDTLDTEHEKVYIGKEAEVVAKEIQHHNSSQSKKD